METTDYGKYTYDWLQLQEQYLDSLADTDTNLNWLSRAIVIIWTSLHQRWRLRCNNATTDTGTEEENIESNIDQHIKEEAARLYALQHTIPARHQYIFHQRIDQFLRKPIPIIKQWLTCNKRFILSLQQEDDDDDEIIIEEPPPPTQSQSPNTISNTTTLHTNNTSLNIHNPCL